MAINSFNNLGVAGDIPVPADYDGDHKTDPAVFRPSTGGWYVLKSSTNYTTSITVFWGLSTDTPVPGDYDGDGKADPAVYRKSTGGWHLLQSSTNYGTSTSVSWGLSTDLPMQGDYDGDGKTDPTVWRPSTGLWCILKSSTNYGTSQVVSWGVSSDIPVPGDYDGDDKIDPAVYRPSTGGWYILKSTTSFTTSVAVFWGLSTDIPIPGDYDGDGMTDPTVERPSTGMWYILESSTGYASSFAYGPGLSGDVLVPGDYDGDGLTDPAVYSGGSGTWTDIESGLLTLRGGKAGATLTGAMLTSATLVYAIMNASNPLPNPLSVWSDWTFGSPSPAWAGMVVRFSDADNLLLAKYQNGEIRLERRQSGAWAGAPLATRTLPSPAVGVHRMRVEVVSNSVRVYWDSVLQLEVTDTSGLSGTRVGLAWSGSDSTATADNFEINANLAPTVSVTSPVTGAGFYQAPGIPLQVSTNDPEGQVGHVEWYANGTQIGDATAAPYGFTFNGAGIGTHVVTAKVYDTVGATTTSMPITITVSNAMPSASLINPANGATFHAPATILVQASAGDPDGTITHVEFYSNGALVGNAAVTTGCGGVDCYQVAPSLGVGTHVMTARSYDNTGAWTASASRTITGTNEPPSVTLAQPNAPFFTAPATVPLLASAGDSDGTIAHVEFYLGATLIGNDTTAPYSAAPSGLAVGTHVFTAQAYDETGATTTSAPINVIVDPHCSHLIVSPASVALGAVGGSANFSVTAPTDCTWTAGQGAWATRVGESSRTGSVTVDYTVPPRYELSSHADTLAIAGQSVTIEQTGQSRTLVYDGFTGTDGTALINHLPDVSLAGGTWAVSGFQQAVLLGQHAGATQQTTEHEFMQTSIATGTADGVISADWTPASAGTLSTYPMGGIVFRKTDDNNFWVAGFGFRAFRAVSLWHIVNGIWTEPVAMSAVADPVGSVHHVEVRLSGPSIEVWWDGTCEISYTDSTGMDATQHGLQWSPFWDWISTFDNVAMLASPTPEITQVIVTPGAPTVPMGGTQNFSAHAYDATGAPIPAALFTWTVSDPGAGSLANLTTFGHTATVLGITGALTITATAIAGPDGSASVTVDAEHTLVFDRFAGADETQLDVHTPDHPGLSAWTAISPVSAWLDQQRASAEYQNTTRDDLGYWIETGAPDATIGADFYPAASGTLSEYPIGWILFRAQDAHNYWAAGYGYGSSTVTLYRVVNDAWQVVTYANPGAQPGRVHRLEVNLNGPAIQVWSDGVLKLQASDMWGVTATKHGLRWSPIWDWLSTFDNFTVTGSVPCVSSVTAQSTVIPATGGSATITVSGPAGCPFTASSDQPLMSWSVPPSSVVSGATPLSSTTATHITVSYDANPTTQNTGGNWRVATIVAGGHLAYVAQPPMPDPCNVTTNPLNGQTVSVSDLGEERMLTIATALSGCYWALSTSAPQWITIVDPDGTASSTPRYIVAQNTNVLLPREGTITVSGPSFAAVTIHIYQAADPPVPGAPVTCPGLNPNSPDLTRNDTAALQDCFDSVAEGGTVALEPGVPGYIINGLPGNGDAHGKGLVLNKRIHITSSSATTRATIIAGRDLFGNILRTKEGGVDGFTIENVSFNGLVDCVPGVPGSEPDNKSCGCVTNETECRNLVPPPIDEQWRRRRNDCYDSPNKHPGNLDLSGNDFKVLHNESKQALCGSGLGLSGSRFLVEDNFVAFNGRDQLAVPTRHCAAPPPSPGDDCFVDAPWADGITVLFCDRGEVYNNYLVDNTDISLAAGGGTECKIISNHLWQGGKYAFAGLSIGNYTGKTNVGSQFSGNTIVNAVVNEHSPGRFIPRLGMGLVVGTHPWIAAPAYDVTDPGFVGPSTQIAGRPDLNVGPNHIEGANVNLVIDGVVDSANPGASLPGEVKNNDISAPLLLPPAFRLSNVPCAESHSFTIYTPHAKITETSGNGPSFEMKYHGLDCASDQNDPVIQGAFRPRRGSQ